MTDNLLKSKISFMDLPREVRKSYLISITNQFRQTMANEPDHDKFTFLDDYKYVSWLKYYAEDYKYDLCQDKHTNDIYCEVSQ